MKFAIVKAEKEFEALSAGERGLSRCFHRYMASAYSLFIPDRESACKREVGILLRPG